MGFFNKYPYTDFHEQNLDWIIAKMRQLEIEFNEFEVVNKITFSGAWDITKQYPAWTIVSDNNIGYVSIQPVPAGVVLSDGNYWRAVIDYSAQIASLQSRVVNCENDIINLQGDVTVLQSDVQTIQHYTGFYNVKDFGAQGDGINDDTQAFKDCITQAQADFASDELVMSTTDVSIGYKIYIPGGKYRLTDTINIDGFLYVEPGQTERRGACVHIVGDGNVQTVLDFTGAPANTDSLYVAGYFVDIEDIRINKSQNNALTIDGDVIGGAFVYLHNIVCSRAANYGLMITTRVFTGVIDHVWCYSCAEGFYVGSTTSITFISCYANSANHGFYINNAIYSKLQTCAADGCAIPYEFTSSNVTMDSCGDEISTGPAININDDCNIVIINHFNYKDTSSMVIFRGSNSNANIIGGEVRDTLSAAITPIINEYSVNPQVNNTLYLTGLKFATGHAIAQNSLGSKITTTYVSKQTLNASGVCDVGTLLNNKGNTYFQCKAVVQIVNLSSGDRNIYELLIVGQSSTISVQGANAGTGADNCNFTFTYTSNKLRATHALGASAAGKEFAFNVCIEGDAVIS